MKPKDRIIWNNIEHLRIKNNLSYTELAAKIGTKPQTLNNIKSGVRGIGSELLKKFADAFNISEGELLMESPALKEKNLPESTSPEKLVFYQSLQNQLRLINLSLEGMLDRINAQGNALQIAQETENNAQ